MSTLAPFLELLAQPGARELVLQNGLPAFLRLDAGSRNLTRQPLQIGHIAALVRGTPFQQLVDEGDVPIAVVNYSGATYHVAVETDGSVVRMRVALAGGASKAQAPNAAESPGKAVAPSVAEPARDERRIELAYDSRDAAPAERPAPAPPRADPAPAPAPVATLRVEPRAAPVMDSSPPERRLSQTFRPGSSAPAQSLARILLDARERNASDVHIMSDRPSQIRVGGELSPTGEVIADAEVREMLGALLTDEHASRLDAVGYADFAIDTERAGRFRVNVSRQRTGLKGCFRLVRPRPPTLEELGLPSELAKVQHHHQGLVIISGPNGSGKTTTLAALVNLFNSTRADHILTVEDPVEIVHPGVKAIISQREVGRHTASFARALKAALREDPDVIVIGELRDRETVEIAVSASETGHLVLATMSTPGGARTIDRLIDMFPPGEQPQIRSTLAGGLKFIISQRLVPRSDRTGLVAAAELITGGVPLWSLIRDNKLFQLPGLLQRGKAFGMIRIEDSLNDLLARGLIDEATARAYADEPKAIVQARPQPPAGAPAEPDRAAARGGFFGMGKR